MIRLVLIKIKKMSFIGYDLSLNFHNKVNYLDNIYKYYFHIKIRKDNNSPE